MKAIDNSGLLNICASCCVSGFAPAATYEYDSDAQTIKVTDTGDYPDGDDLLILHVYVTDVMGGKKYDKIVAPGGNVTIDVSELDAIGGFSVNVTFITNNRLRADAGVFNVGSTAPDSGNVRYINKSTC